MMTQWYQELVEKGKELENLQATIQDTRQAPSISSVKSNTMKNSRMVISCFSNISQEHFGDFKNHIRHFLFLIVKEYGL